MAAWVALGIVGAFGACVMALLSLAFWRFPALWDPKRRLRAYGFGVAGILAGYWGWLAVVGLLLGLRLAWWEAGLGLLGIAGAEGLGVAAVHGWQELSAPAETAAIRQSLEPKA